MRGAMLRRIFWTSFLSFGLAVRVAGADIESGLVAHYPCEEGQGGVVHNEAKDTIAQDGQAIGQEGVTYEWVEGRVGKFAMLFHGQDGTVVDCGTWNPSQATGQLTVAAWIKWAGLNAKYQGVVAKRDSWTATDTCWHVELNIDTGNVAFGRYDSYPSFGTNIPPVGEWQHVAVTFDGTTSAMYIDGVSVGTSAAFSFGPKTDAHVVFGAVEGAGWNPFNGAIDEVRIYSRALSAEDIAELYEWTGERAKVLVNGERVKGNWCYGGDTITLDGSVWSDSSNWHWEQIEPHDPTVTLNPSPYPPDGKCTFQAPSVAVGFPMTFRLTVLVKGETQTEELVVNVRSAGPPQVPPTNFRLLPTDKGFWAVWDTVFDAARYDIALEVAPGVWFPYATDLAFEPGKQPMYEFKNLLVGQKYGVKVTCKNAKGSGAESGVLYYRIGRNLALPAPAGATPPSNYVYVISHYSITGMNNKAYDDNNDSWNGAYKAEDYWGYLWPNALYFDSIAYFIGNVFFDGAWFTELTVEYTEDGTTWKKVPNVKIDPAYDFTNAPAGRPAFGRFDISFPCVRGKGIRIYGVPGGMAYFTSISELEVYGDQTRGVIVVQGVDADVPERTTAKLDGSYSFSTAGAITSYKWEQVSGPTVTINDSTSAIANFAAPGVDADTVYVFKLTAQDDKGNSGTDDSVRIVVKNLKTTAVAGPDQQVPEGTVVTLDGRGSISTSATIIYQWTGPPGITLSVPTPGTCSFTAPEIWSHTKKLAFQLQVTDGVGGSSTDTVNVVVMNPIFDVKPLARYYWTDLLHLGQTPTDRFLAPLDQSLDTNDYLAKWGGQVNANPMAGDVCDFTDTGITTTVNPMIWTPIHDDAGWYGDEGLDNFGQMYHIYIFCPEQREARLRMRFDDEVRVWNNGAVAFSADAWDNGTEGWRNCTLYEGVNSMTLRFEEGGGGNYIAARLTNRLDVPYTDLLYSLSVPNPLPNAYALRDLPGSYEAGGDVPVKLSLRANPDALPPTITLRETIPAGTEVVDLGGGQKIGNEIGWSIPGTAVKTITYTLRALAGTTGGLPFTGNMSYSGVPEQGIYGENVIYEVPSAPPNLSVEMLLAAHLSWSASPQAGILGYRIYSSVDGAAWQEIAFVTTTSYIDKWTEEGKGYRYKVAAVNMGGVEGSATVPTDEARITMELREAENFNFGGGQWPGYQNCPAATEATAADQVQCTNDYWHPNTGGPRDYRPNDDIGIETVEEVDRPGTFHTNIGWIDAGSWYKYTFDVPAAGWIKLTFRVASPSGGVLAAYWDGNLIGTTSYVTGNWHIFTYAAVEEEVQTTSGIHVLRVESVSGELNLDTIGIGYNWTPPKRQAIFEDDFESYATLYSNADIIAGGKWTVQGTAGALGAWRLWITTGDKLGDESPDLADVDNKYVITDTDLAGAVDADEQLITKEIDCTEWIKLRLNFDRNYRAYLEDTVHAQTADVDVRVITAGVPGSWVNLLHLDKSIFAPGTDPAIDSGSEEFDLSAYDGKKIQLRWRFYNANYDYWFAVDNVKLSGEKKPVEKGAIQQMRLVAGKVELSWSTFGPGNYTVEYTDDIAKGDWKPVTGTWPSTQTTWPGEATTGIKTRFYRVRSQ